MGQIAEILAKNMKRLRKLKGFTQEDLAHRAGYSLENVKKLETRGTWVSADGVERLAAALEVPESALFSEENAVPFEKYDQESQAWQRDYDELQRENEALKTALRALASDPSSARKSALSSIRAQVLDMIGRAGDDELESILTTLATYFEPEAPAEEPIAKRRVK